MAKAKKDVLSMKSVAYWSGCNGLEIKGIEYGIEDYVLCISNAWYGNAKPHRCKIYYGTGNESPFFRVDGCKIPFSECIRI